MSFYEVFKDQEEYAEWVQSRPREDWDFGDLHDELLAAIAALRDAAQSSVVIAQERDDAWRVAREILAELGYPQRITQFQQEHPRLKEEPADQEEPPGTMINRG